MSSLLAISEIELHKFIRTAPHRYKTYNIPKRNNKGVRLIAQPSKNTKYLQRMIMLRYFTDLPVHQAAVAYRKGIGIKENAQRHTGNQYILKMDFKNFFPSIVPSVFIKHIRKYIDIQLTEEDEQLIRSMFFWSKCRSETYQLSIGAPTSPFISNTIMFDFDSVLEELCGDRVVYTRYADDLIFSTNEKNILYALPAAVEKIIDSEQYRHFNLNYGKTIFLSKKQNRMITGLTIDNDGSISIGRDKKRFIKHMIHLYSIGKLSTEKIVSLQGYLAFINDVEPDLLVRLKKKYGERVINDIKKGSDT